MYDTYAKQLGPSDTRMKSGDAEWWGEEEDLQRIPFSQLQVGKCLKAFVEDSRSKSL